jgi:hypothetical protein
MQNGTDQRMNDIRQHLENERLHRIRRAWKYLTPRQKAWLFLRAWWWSLPSVVDLLERHRARVEQRWVYRLYKVHWVK